MTDPKLALAALGLCLAACAAPVADGVTPAAVVNPSARALNEAAFAQHGSRLAAEAPGQWVLIVGGEVHGPWPEFDAAWAAAEPLARGAPHAFLYRAGVDDQDDSFVLSPFLNEDPHWTQMGWRLGQPMRITIDMARDVWSREVDGRVLQAAWGGPTARLVLRAPGDTVGTAAVRSVCSGLFEQDLTITEAVAAQLALDRFEAPGTATYLGRPEACRKVLVRVAIDELEVDVPAVAFVLPRSITGEPSPITAK